MFIRSLLVCLIIVSSLSFSAAASDNINEVAAVQGGDRDIHWWCSTTTHPEICTHHMTGRFGHDFKPKRRFEFRNMAVRVALERALETQQTAAKLLEEDVRADQSVGRFDTMVRMDCHKLIENTVLQLNRTLERFRPDSPSTSRAYSDSQTWLSTALTNIETCRSGCAEVNVSYDVVGPIVSRNISELISNSLAVNTALMDEHRKSSIATAAATTTTGDKFPSWVTVGERRLLQSSTSSLESQADSIVSVNGTGHFRYVQDAIDHAMTTSERKGNRRVVIYIKKGVYKENVVISSWMSRITLVGDGYNDTIITGERSVGGGYTTYSSATFGVDGPEFMARGITFQNTAGPQRGQAVALRSASDLSVFYECSFEGYQDTLFLLAQRQFYKSCQIHGTVDFVFGNAAAVLQDCTFYVRKPMWGQINVVTAQGRADPYQNTGISIHNCRITADSDLRPVARSYQTYLGRPWQRHSRTVVLKSYIDGHVNPQGWLRWRNSDFALTTLYYGEYMNSGPGATTALRVKWPGYHVITDSEVASNFTVSNLIAGETWLPSTAVPFTAGL